MKMKRPDAMTEMMVSSSAAIAFSSFLIYTLAMSDKVLIRGLEVEGMEETVTNVIDAALPLTTTDVVSVALGEAFAGIITAVAWYVISSALRMKERMDRANVPPAVNAVADGDFFVTRAALLPFLEAFGVPPFVASIASVVVATVPSELVKIGSKQRQQRMEENMEMERLLLLQQQQRKNEGPLSFFSLGFITNRFQQPRRQEAAVAEASVVVDVTSLKPIVEQKDSVIVETFADIVKWLEYDILCREYGGQLGLFPGAEGAIFGTLCAVSSQMYTDLLYLGFNAAGETKRRQLLSRTAAEWSATYLYRCISVATLFGVYQQVQTPAKMLIQSLQTGSFDACLGSDDYELCAETFQDFNPVNTASIVSEIQALGVEFISLWNRFAEFIGL
jgi:hypothetical protein